MIEAQEVFGIHLPVTVNIDRSKTFEEMFRAAHRKTPHAQERMTCISQTVRDKYDSYRRHVTETVEIRGFLNEREMITTTVLRELDAFGMAPASIIHWLAFSAICPEILKEYPGVFVWALGGGYEDQGNKLLVRKKKSQSPIVIAPMMYYMSTRWQPELMSLGGPCLKYLDSREISDRKKWEARKYVFLAVAKQGTEKVPGAL